MIKELEQIMEEECEKGGFTGKREIKEGKEEAYIILKNPQRIHIGFSKQIAEKEPEKARRMTRDKTRHEINHSKYSGLNGCPRNVELHDKNVFSPIDEVLKPKGYGLRDVGYLANALEDCVLHTDGSKRFSWEGIVDFFELQGDKNNRYTEFYEAHVRLNLYLFGNKKQKKRLSKFMSNSPEINEVVKNFLERSKLSELKRDKRKDRNKIRDFLNDENNWSKFAKIYAEEFSKLMKPGYSMPMFDNSGEGTEGSEQSPEEGATPTEPVERDYDDVPNESPFDEEMFSPSYKQKRVEDAQREGKKLPSWINPYEGKDLIYQSLAKRLNIRARSFTQSESMPYFHYGSRPFNPVRDNFRNVKLGFNKNGKIELKKPQFHNDTPMEYSESPEGFPEVRYCVLDTSGSMKESPNNDDNVGKKTIIPWGDKSKYHYSLLGWYGLLEYLKENGLLKQTGISLANFSTETVIGNGLREAKKIALNPQFGITKLSLEKIMKAFSGRDALLFTISDGDLENWESYYKDPVVDASGNTIEEGILFKQKFMEYASKHNYFHIQIGSENGFSKDLANAGFKVVNVKGDSDLAGVVIDITNRLYRGVA